MGWFHARRGRFRGLNRRIVWTHVLAVSWLVGVWSTVTLVGMYLRVTSRTNADGSVVRYVALAHNRRVDGQTRAQRCEAIQFLVA